MIDDVKSPEPPRVHRGVPKVQKRKWPGRARIVPIPTAPTSGLTIVRPHSRLKRAIVISLFILIAVLAVTILARQPLGLALVVGYGVFAFIRRVSSRMTFAVALITITLVPVSLLLFGGRNVVTSALASYAFLLLAVGVITAWRDVSKPPLAN